jgi:hypothetical protein
MPKGNMGRSVKVWLPALWTGVTPFVATTVMVRVENALLTVPEMTPAGEKTNPDGRVPEVMAKVGAGKPVAANVCV